MVHFRENALVYFLSKLRRVDENYSKGLWISSGVLTKLSPYPLFSPGCVWEVGRNATTTTQTHEGSCSEVKVEGANTQLEAQKNHLLLGPKLRKAWHRRMCWFQTWDCRLRVRTGALGSAHVSMSFSTLFVTPRKHVAWCIHALTKYWDLWAFWGNWLAHWKQKGTWHGFSGRAAFREKTFLENSDGFALEPEVALRVSYLWFK